jgi:hypothetical protein
VALGARKGEVKLRYLLFGLGALVIAFMAQRLVSPGEGPEVREAIETAFLSSDPSYCDEVQTDAYLRQRYGVDPVFADDACEEHAEDSRIEAVDISDLQIEDDSATAEVTFDGGLADASTLLLALVKDDGQWKLDRTVEIVTFARTAFLNGYAQFLRDGSFTAASARCVIDRLDALPDTVLQQGLIDERKRTRFVETGIACDRGAVEDDLIPRGEQNDLGYPTRAVIKCARDQVSGVSDSRLAALFTDFVGLGRIYFDCGAYDDQLRGYLRELEGEGYEDDVVSCIGTDLRDRSVRELVQISFDQEEFARLFAECSDN